MIAEAGNDIGVCATETEIWLGEATAEHYASLIWTTAGDGSFANDALLNTTYYPGTQDIASGSVELSLTAESMAPCNTTVTDQLMLEFAPLPEVDAGADQQTCQSNVVSLAATAENYTIVSWENLTGDGTVTCPDCLNTTFVPGDTDIENGFVWLSITAFAEEPCVESVMDSLFIEIMEGPFAYAGADAGVCPGESYHLSGFVENNSGMQWSSSGDGTFNNTQFLNAIYYPGSGDIANGSVELSLTANAMAPCTESYTDAMTLTIYALPQTDAGADFTVMQNTPAQLNGSMSGGSGSLQALWSPAELLDDPTIINPTTLPLQQTTVFTLNVEDLTYGCQADDEVTVIVEPGTTYTISGSLESQNLRNPIQDAWMHFRGDYYTDSTVTDSSGSFTIDIPSGWTGWAMPDYPGYIFIPDSIHYQYLDENINDAFYTGTLFLEAIADPDSTFLGNMVNLSANVINPTGTITYQWSSIPEGFVSDSPEPTDYPFESIVYKVIVTDALETAWDTVGVFVDTVSVGFGENRNNIVMKMYPNPAKNFLTIDLIGKHQLYAIRILSIEGQLMKEERIDGHNNFIRKLFNIQTLPNGVYIIELIDSSGESIKAKQFVKAPY